MYPERVIVTIISSSARRSSIGRLTHDFRASRIAVRFLDGQELLPNDRHQLRVGGEDALQLRDEGDHLLVLLDDLVPLELSEALKTHVEDGAGLDLREIELPHQRFACRVRAVGLPDEPDDEVELLHGFP
jgi:hypothetical protein